MKFRMPLLCLAFLLMVLCACSSDQSALSGKYASQSEDVDVVLVIDVSGKGTWSTDSDEVTFKWSLQGGDQLWLHTKEGGVLQGKIDGERILLALPGGEPVIFIRQ